MTDVTGETIESDEDDMRRLSVKTEKWHIVPSAYPHHQSTSRAMCVITSRNLIIGALTTCRLVRIPTVPP